MYLINDLTDTTPVYEPEFFNRNEYYLCSDSTKDNQIFDVYVYKSRSTQHLACCQYFGGRYFSARIILQYSSGNLLNSLASLESFNSTPGFYERLKAALTLKQKSIDIPLDVLQNFSSLGD